MPHRLSLLLAAALALLASPALAQNYVARTNTGTYPTLSTPTVLTLTDLNGRADKDRGTASLSLGFTFPYYTRTYTQATVSSNGLLWFEPSTVASDFLSNLVMPSTAEPQAVVAPFWDDLEGSNATSEVRWQALSTSTRGAGIAIEWFNWSRRFASGSMTFQARLWENGEVEFYYETLTLQGTSPSGTIGIEDDTGQLGTNGLTSPDGGVACSGGANRCTLADFDPTRSGTPINVIQFGPPPGVDLQALGLRVVSMSPTDAGLSITTELRVRNFGTDASGPFAYRVLLSEDTLEDDFDPPLSPELRAGPSLSRMQSTFLASPGTIIRPDAGSWYLVARVDPDGGIAETNERNNTVSTSAPYAAGVDLFAESISGPPLGGPGDQLSVDVRFSNQGFDSAGDVTVRVWLSLDPLLEAGPGGDTLLFSTSVFVGNGASVARTLDFAVPRATEQGRYFVILQLVPAGGVVESSTSNNVVTSRTFLEIRQADLVVDDFEVQDVAPPFSPATAAYFDAGIRLLATVRNAGGARADDVSVQFFLSDNEFLSAAADPQLGQPCPPGFLLDAGVQPTPGCTERFTLGAGQSRQVVVTRTVPAADLSGRPLPRGQYYFFANGQAPGLAQLDEQNDSRRRGPLLVTQPVPNLVAASVVAPLRLGVGESFLVRRLIRNTGLVGAGDVAYRYVLSANELITEADVPLTMQRGNRFVVDGVIPSIAAGGEDNAEDVVLAPADITAGQWYLGLVVDPLGAIEEASKLDNGAASGQVTVAASGLAITTTALGTGLVDRPYYWPLGARGGTGVYSWSVGDPAQLPPGLTLAPGGTLSGTPTRAGTYTFRLIVTSGGKRGEAQAALMVLPVASPLEVATTSLPALISAQSYSAVLLARGGLRPITWSVVSGALPEGVELSTDGRLGGLPRGAPGEASTFTVLARDAVGNTAARSFRLQLVGPQPLLLEAFVESPDGGGAIVDQGQLPVAFVGAAYSVPLRLRSIDGTPVSQPVSWQSFGSGLPDGVELQRSTLSQTALAGIPRLPGQYETVVEARDNASRVASRRYFITVLQATPPLIVGDVPPLTRGQDVSVQLRVEPEAPLRFFLRFGDLPDGLTLSPEGLLSGTVGADIPPGTVFNVVVGAGLTSRTPITLRSYRLGVDEVAFPEPGGCGCASGGTGAAWLLLGLALRGRRRAATSRPA